MDKTFEVELIRLSRNGEDQAAVVIKQEGDYISFVTSNGLVSAAALLLPSEAVTIGEQLIAAGKAGEV
ncbi:hypothetical protein ABW45_04590 [Stenotrophomonas maltophilia]|nr:hypothetical protein ABW45_04590 [Stenotrophomonas maltophilia]